MIIIIFRPSVSRIIIIIIIIIIITIIIIIFFFISKVADLEVMRLDEVGK